MAATGTQPSGRAAAPATGPEVAGKTDPAIAAQQQVETDRVSATTVPFPTLVFADCSLATLSLDRREPLIAEVASRMLMIRFGLLGR